MKTMITHFSKFTQWLSGSFVFIVVLLIGATIILVNVAAAPEGAPTVSNLGSAEFVQGRATLNTRPTLTFDATGADALDTMVYDIGIFSDAGFSVPVVEFTSDVLPAETTSFSYQVGQSDGTYTTGAEAMRLTEGAYYWRVQVTALHEVSDGRGGFEVTPLSSDYALANSGGVAFIVDITAPDITNVSAEVSSVADEVAGTDHTIVITWDTENESSSSTVEYGMTDVYGATATGDAGVTHRVTIACNTEDAPTDSFSCTDDATVHYRVISIDTATNESTSSDDTFVLNAVADEVVVETERGHGRAESRESIESEEREVAVEKEKQAIASIGALTKETGIEREVIGAVILGGSNNEPMRVVLREDLKKGRFNDEVKILQQYLNQHGYIIATEGRGSPGNETRYFGRKLKSALAKFQLEVMQGKSGIVPIEPLGQFGVTTRMYINTLQ